MASETILNNRYRLLSQHGSGGMAVIYKAIDQLLGRTVAVKILRPSLTTDQSFLARFRAEARSVANLQHPNIVTVFDVGQDGPTQYIVMEFVDGTDLKKIIKTGAPLPLARVLELGIQLCAGIGFAHRSMLVHADVKPQNILVTHEDMVKVTDFGIAQALTNTQPGERQSVVWGSPHYFAPEQARGERPSPASDVYSIGIVLFEMVTGQLPFTGQSQQDLALAHIRDPIPLITQYVPDAPDTLTKIIYKTMSKVPEERYRMADQLMNILKEYQKRGFVNELPVVVLSRPPVASASTNPVESASRQGTPTPNSAIPLPPSAYGSNSAWSQAGSPIQNPTVPGQQGNNLTGRAPTPLPQGIDPIAPATQRYGLAPNAPPSAYAPQNPQTLQNPQQRPPFGGAPFGGSTSQMNVPINQSQQYRPQSAAPAMDGVTVLLAILAFLSVGGLIPLYIVVIVGWLS